MDKVYVVTAGAYSDYHIIGAFSTKEKAQEYCDRFNAGSPYVDANVEEYPIDVALNRNFLYETVMYVSYDKTMDNPYESTKFIHPDEYNNGKEFNSEISYDRENKPFVFAYASTAEKSKKIAHDLWTQVQAKEAGI